MARRTVQVDGLQELYRKLEELPPHIAAAAETAVGAEVEEIADDMRRHAPVDTGELRDGIQAEHEGLEGQAVSTARHSQAVEHGTSSTPEQPFARPAAEASRRRFPKRLAEEIDAQVREVAG